MPASPSQLEYAAQHMGHFGKKATTTPNIPAVADRTGASARDLLVQAAGWH